MATMETNVVDGQDFTSRVLRASNPMIQTLNTIEEHETTQLSTVPAAVMKDLVKIFKLLSDETRLRILFDLSQCDELHVRALCERLRQSQPAVSHHLALLRMAGLIECRREGKHNFYRVIPERVESILDRVFEGVPQSERLLRVGNYSLTCDPSAETL
jgi:ArsR family transcriptional regulator